MKEQKRAQAAIEFLATYGWAFLIIIIVIGALSYFGILSPSKLLPDRCNFGSEFGCVDYGIGGNGALIKLRNGLGVPVVIDDLSVSTEKSQLSCNSTAIGVLWKAGAVKSIPIGCSFANSDIVQGDKGKLNLKIKYHSAKSSSAFGKEVQGDLYSTVKNGDVSYVVTCRDLLNEGASASGTYTIFADGKFSSTYCDMTTDGGGWTLVARMTNGCATDSRNSVGTLTSNSQATCAKLSDAQINAIRTSTISDGIFWGYHEGSPYALPPTGRFLKIITGEFNAYDPLSTLTQQCSCVSTGPWSVTYNYHSSMAGVYNHDSVVGWRCVTVGQDGCTNAHVYSDGLFLYQHGLHILGTFPSDPHGVPGGKNGYLYIR